MEQTKTNSQEQDGDSTNKNENLNASVDGYVNLPFENDSGKEKQLAGSDITETETETKGETSSNNNGSKAEQVDVKSNTETKDLVRGLNGSWNNVEDKKRTEEALKVIKNQKTHDLYCPNCTHNITTTAKLFEQGKETFPYSKERFVLGFVIIVSFKYPFIYIPWFYNKSSEKTVTTNPPNPFPNPQEQVVDPNPPNPFPNPHEQAVDTNPSDLITSPPDVPSTITPIDPDPNSREPVPSPRLRLLLVVVLLLLSVILLWFLPSGGGGNNKGGFSLSWLIHSQIIKYISLFLLLLFVAILAMSWRAKPDSAKFPSWRYIVAPIKNLIPTELDILKSIVYGGLIESITSFGVVSSAAGSGTSTLNVLALGLANLFSGLFLIAHNLYGLIYHPRLRFQGANNDHMQNLVAEEDPYKELLGNRLKVFRHCFVVVVSFIFFAVIPPLFYGFSYKITDKGHYQEAAVFVAASLVCVVSLSFAKAYAFGINKPKTMAAYTGIAIVASALSFVASQYLRDVFEKYEFHKFASHYLKG